MTNVRQPIRQSQGGKGEPRAGLGEVSSRKLRDIATGGGSEGMGTCAGHAAGAGEPDAGALRPGTHPVLRGQPSAALHVRGAGTCHQPQPSMSRSAGRRCGDDVVAAPLSDAKAT